MSHTIISTKHGYIVASTLAGNVVNAKLFATYGEALALWVRL